MRNLTIRKFASFEEEKQANKKFNHLLNPEERFQIAFEIMKQVHGDLSQYLDIREYHRTTPHGCIFRGK